MKKLLALMLAAALALSLVACGGGGETGDRDTPSTGNGDTTSTDTPSGGEDSTPPTDAETTPPEEEPTNDVQTLSFGDAITTEYFEFTPAFGGFTDEVANWPDENYLTPDGTFYGANPFKANEEKTMMWFSGTVNYLGGSTSNETFTYDYKIIYDNDYEFDIKEGEGYTKDIASGKWGDGYSMTFEPLSSNTTRYVRFCIEVPEQLEINTDKTLSVIFIIDDNEYIYNIR